MGKLTLPAAFWVRSTWPWTMVVLCFVGELPWILLMDTRGLSRSIYGTDVLRVAGARLFGSDHPSMNVFGWLTDMDKIFPYVATLVVFALFRAYLRRRARTSEGNQEGGRIPRRFSAAVTAWGVFGAFLITLHYATSNSGHYTSYQDKGLLDAAAHIYHGGFAPTWVAIFLYRLTYLLLSPWAYFLLFATTGAATLETWTRLGSREARARRGATDDVARCLLIAGLPPVLLLLLHDVANWTFGLGRYSPGGVRRYILISLYGAFLLCILVAIFLRVQGLHRVGRSPRATNAARITLGSLHNSLRRDTARLRLHSGRLVWIGGLVFLFLPAGRLFTDIGTLRSSPLNRGVGAAAAFYVNDFHHLPRWANSFDRLLDRGLRKDLPHDLMEMASEPSSPSMRAVVLAVVALGQLGLTPTEIEQLGHRLRSRDSDSSGCELLEGRFDELIENYPMYRAGAEARRSFEGRLRDLCEAFKAADSSINWDLGAEEDLGTAIRLIERFYADDGSTVRARREDPAAVGALAAIP